MGTGQCCGNSPGVDTNDQQMPKQEGRTPGADSLPTLEPAAVTAVNNAGNERKGAVEYAIKLDRSTGDRLGVDVDNQDGLTLLIDSITGGLVSSWNSSNSDNKVKAGDRIVEVNDVRGDLAQMVEECKKNKMLKIILMRG